MTIKYKCNNCGAEDRYTLTMKRDVSFIFDGPHWPPIGEDDSGCTVMVKCNVCGWDLDPNPKDFDRLYVPRKGVVFYK